MQEPFSHGTGSAASCCAHTWFNEESALYISCFLFCELTHTRTRMNSRQTALNYMHSQVKPSTVVYLRFSHVPAFYVSAASVFYLLHTFCLLFLTLSSCSFSIFSFAAPLCQQVMQCSHHCCVDVPVCHKRNNKWDDEEKHRESERDRRDGHKKLTVICTDGGTPAL